MPGIPLAAIGAGLGQWANFQQQQAAARERQQMLALQLQNMQQQLRDRQGTEQLGSVDFSGLGGGTSITPVNPIPSGGGVGTPIPAVARAAPAALAFDNVLRGQSGAGFGGGQPMAGGGPLGGRGDALSAFAPGNRNEGISVTSRAPGPEAYAGLSGPGAPTAPTPYTTGTMQQDTRGGENAPTEMRMADASGAPPAAAAPQQGDLASEIAKIPMPSLPNLNIDAVRQRINQQAPNAPWTAKEQMLRNYIAHHGPEATRQYDQAMEQYKQRVGIVTEEWRHRRDRQETLSDREATGGTITKGPGGEAFSVRGRKADPIVRSDTGEPLVTEGAKRASSNISIVDAEGKNIFKGSAHPDPNAKEGESSWIDDKTQKRIEVPPDANLTIMGRGGEGRQAAAQMIRLTSAANEARRQIGNVAEMTVGATTSWFQGLQSSAGKDLAEGLKRTLANQITPRDEQMMSALGRGIGRSLASLETAGAATGLVNLQESMGGLMPSKGDDRATILMKIAEMRQIAEQGIESAMAAPAVGDEQKKLLRAVRDDVAKAVPFTVPDVIKLVRKPGAETYQSFAEKIGLGKKGEPGATPATPGGASTGGGEVIQNGWRYDAKTHQPIGPVQ